MMHLWLDHGKKKNNKPRDAEGEGTRHTRKGKENQADWEEKLYILRG
jgi:hypothetical protein